MNKYDKIIAETEKLIRSGERMAKRVADAKQLPSSSSADLTNGLDSGCSGKVQVIIEREDPLLNAHI